MGASSLFKNTLAGAMNSLSVITDSLAVGLSSMTFDQEFLQIRKKMKMKKPKNIFQGFGYGAKAIGTGVLSGITGVFTKPFEGAQDNGVNGLIKGSFFGVS